MKKNLLKTMLVAVALTMGVSAQAQQTKKIIYSADFETGVATDYWKIGNGGLFSGRHNGTVAGVKASQDRGDWIPTNATFTEGEDYNIELDFYPVTNNRHHEFAVMSGSAWDSWTSNYGFFWKNNSTQEHNAFLFFFDFSNDNATINKGYGDDNGDAMTFTSGKWYHLELNVHATERTVDYAITQEDDETVFFAGSYTLPEGESTDCKGFYVRNSRYNYNEGSIGLDNIEIYQLVDGIVAQNPSVALTKVDGNDRIYTITIAEGETLHYTVPGGEEQTSTTLQTEVRVSLSGNLLAYTTIADAMSDVVTVEVTTGAISLAEPTYSVTDLGAGFSKTFAVSIDNSKVLLTPEATLTYSFTPADGTEGIADEKLPAELVSTKAGTYTITATAEGYTSSTLTIVNNKSYKQDRAIKFYELTADDFSTDLWTTGTGELRDAWTNNSSAIPADATYYHLIETTEENMANAFANLGITLSTNREPWVYVGYGLLTPYAVVRGSGNYMNINIKNFEADDYAVYTGWGSYGAGTFKTVLKSSETFGLYRYDTMLRDITIYTVDQTVDVTTAIQDMKAAQPAAADAIYNLRGQRVQNAQKGLYIVGGKKVIK